MKKVKNQFLVILVILSVLIGCNIKGSKMDTGQAIDCVKKITYVYDSRTDICYALVASRRQASAEQSGLGITIVPYEKVKHLVRPENIIK